MRVKFIALCFFLFCLFCVPVYADDDSGASSVPADSSASFDVPTPTPTIEEQADSLGGDLSSAFTNSSGGLIDQLNDVEHNFDITFPEGQNGLLDFFAFMAGVIPLEVSFCFLLGFVLMCVAVVKRHFER